MTTTNDKKWIFNSPEEGQVEVPLERWIWGALYNDGTELHQYDDKGVFHQIGEVDQSKVQLWVLYKADGPGRIDYVVPPGAKLIHKHRVLRLDVGEPNERTIRVCMFGYKHQGIEHLNYILPDDRIVQANTQQIQLTKFGI